MFVTTKIDALLRLPEVLAIFPISRSTWYQGIKDGRYPLPVKIGPRASAWRVSEIEKLIAGSPSAEIGTGN
jgi:predicted DNA-binding transcriptional regulator AlpA